MDNNTGIIRRVDDLGRIVIPKEIRRCLGIREGDPLEILADTSNRSISLRPFSCMNSIHDFTQMLLDAYCEATRRTIFVTDLHRVSAASGYSKSDLEGELLDPIYIELIRERHSVDYGSRDIFIVDGDPFIKASVFHPIISSGEPVGSVGFVKDVPEEPDIDSLKTIAKATALAIQSYLDT